jgi:hypothetical protein
LRSLAFGSIPIDKRNITKSFDDGTEFSLYRRGWVTLSGLACGDCVPSIEHRQEVLDHIVEELWPNLKGGATATAKRPADAPVRIASFEEAFVLDWSHNASEDRIRQLIQGCNRTPEQLTDITATWELKRGWNHGDTPDSSLYTKRILEEALWLQPFFSWTFQDVVDMVVTFCKKNQIRWSLGRAKKQICDGLHHILSSTQQPQTYVSTDSVAAFVPKLLNHTPTLTCNGSQIISGENRDAERALTRLRVNNLPDEEEAKLRDTLEAILNSDEQVKLSRGFRHKSVRRDAVLQAINQYRGWVKTMTIAARIGISVEAAKKQLQRLGRAGLVDGDGKGRYRKHHERKRRELKPCREKPIPKCRGTEKDRKTLSRSELSKRGWPAALIEKIFPEAGTDYIEKEIVPEDRIGHVVRARFYRLARIREIELQLWFEVERAKYRVATFHVDQSRETASTINGGRGTR